MGHSFQIENEDLEQNLNLIEEVQEWLQFDHGPFYDYKKSYSSTATDRLEFKTLYDLLSEVPNYTNVVYIAECYEYHGKTWSFEFVQVHSYVNKGQAVDDKIFLATTHRHIRVEFQDDVMAVDFKLRFL